MLVLVIFFYWLHNRTIQEMLNRQIETKLVHWIDYLDTSGNNTINNYATIFQSLLFIQRLINNNISIKSIETLQILFLGFEKSKV
jgi:hypothetical protein